jgi:hypothetical protein
MGKIQRPKKFAKRMLIGLFAFLLSFWMSSPYRTSAYSHWVSQVVNENCGITVGMSRGDAMALLRECGKIVPASWNENEFYLWYAISPRFPNAAWFYIDPWRGCEFRINFDDAGKVQYLHGEKPVERPIM